MIATPKTTPWMPGIMSPSSACSISASGIRIDRADHRPPDGADAAEQRDDQRLRRGQHAEHASAA